MKYNVQWSTVQPSSSSRWFTSAPFFSKTRVMSVLLSYSKHESRSTTLITDIGRHFSIQQLNNHTDVTKTHFIKHTIFWTAIDFGDINWNMALWYKICLFNCSQCTLMLRELWIIPEMTISWRCIVWKMV